MFLTGCIYCSPRPSSRLWRNRHPRCAGQLHCVESVTVHVFTKLYDEWPQAAFALFYRQWFRLRMRFVGSSKRIDFLLGLNKNIITSYSRSESKHTRIIKKNITYMHLLYEVSKMNAEWGNRVCFFYHWKHFNDLDQCFSTAGPWPGTGPWHQLYLAARGLRKLQYATRFH